MTDSRSRFRSRYLLASLTILSAPLLLADCGKGMPKMPGGSCPANIADASALMDANFGLEASLEGKVKAALAAGANLQKLAAEMEAEVAMACGNLAKDLGAEVPAAEEGPGKKAEAACTAATTAIGELKAKASGTLVVKAEPPVCSASMSAVADCSAKCDASFDPGSAKLECEGGEISGKCSAECSGKCSVEAGAQCEGSCSGTCNGKCDAEISGKCDGTCNGKCDGKDSSGKCAGNCDGKCDGTANASCSGSCSGQCSASCTMQASGSCEGSCSGECSAEFEAPRCSGEIKPPEVSAECQANCDAEVKANMECTPGGLFVKVEGAADAEAAGKLQAALVANLPALLKVSIGMKDKAAGVVGNVKASLEGVQAAVQGGGKAALKVAGCFAASLDAQAKAAVQIDVSVKASASASAEAGAG